MGVAVVDTGEWMLVIDGLVEKPYHLSLEKLRQFPKTTITSFHECYGSPIKPAVENLWRVGNVKWSGVPLKTLLSKAIPLPDAQYVWSEGLDYGEFHGVVADRYQKDLPLDKAMAAEVLVAYEIIGEPLSKERGGLVRLVVPGWFGTNSTKWLSNLSLRNGRAQGPYTTTFYNRVDPDDPNRGLKPVWAVEPSSMIVAPASEACIKTSNFDVEGWAWSHDGIKKVCVSIDDGISWTKARITPRKDFSWQRFLASVNVRPGNGSDLVIVAKATSNFGLTQPDSRRRNHIHRVSVNVDLTERS